MPRTLLVAPAGRNVGLTTACLGFVRALDRLGARVAFVKPIAENGEDRSGPLMRLATRVDPPDPIERRAAEERLAAGDDQTLMEEVVALCSSDAARFLLPWAIWRLCRIKRRSSSEIRVLKSIPCSGISMLRKISFPLDDVDTIGKSGASRSSRSPDSATAL